MLLYIFAFYHLVNRVFLLNASETAFNVEYQWTFINFTWNNEEQYKTAITNYIYIPEHNAMAGIKIYKDKIYIAMPRIRRGSPVTLGYIYQNASKTNPLIHPFPSWRINELNGDCDHLQSVQSMEIDKSGVMWVLDGLRINNFTSCPPKLILFDLNNEEVTILLTYTFANEICLSKGGFLNDIVVDDSDGDFAYITDNSPIDPGLIIFSRSKNDAWKVRDGSMFPEVKATNFEVNGEKFSQLVPIDGIALSPKNQNGSRFVYYCALTGFNLYSIDTEILKNEELCLGGAWRAKVKFNGEKPSSSDGMVMDDKGNLYYGLLPLYAVGRWNINEPFSKAEILDSNNQTMIWTDSFALDDQGYLYLLSNNIHKFFNPNYQLQITDEIVFRILKIFIGNKSYLY